MSDDNNEKRPLLPRLRFPGFDGEVSTLPLAAVADLVSEKINVDQLTSKQYVSTENLLPDFGGMSPAVKLPSVSYVSRFQPNDILISNIRPYLKKVWQADLCGGVSNDVLVFRAKERVVDAKYLAAVLRSDFFIDYVMRGAKGVKMPRGEISMVKEFPVPRPHADEQQKIAGCLSSLDELITVEGRKLEVLKAHKESLMPQLFPREGEAFPRLRFSKFQHTGEWKKRTVSALLARSINPVDVDADATYQEIGIRSHGKGVFHKEFVIGKSLGAKRVFWVKENAFVVNIVFAWEQAVAVTSAAENGMIASHRFPMYVAKPGKANVDFIKYFFLTKKGKELLGIASPGGAGRNKTLGQKEFENLEFMLPATVAEQNEIANFLSSLNALITTQGQKVEALKIHRKGLAQQLFPVLNEVQE